MCVEMKSVLRQSIVSKLISVKVLKKNQGNCPESHFHLIIAVSTPLYGQLMLRVLCLPGVKSADI